MSDKIISFPKKIISTKKRWRCEVAVYYPAFVLEAESYDECMDIIENSSWTHGDASFDIEEIIEHSSWTHGDASFDIEEITDE